MLGFVKQALDLKVRPSALGSYFKEKGIQFGAEHLFRFLTRHVAFIQVWRKGKDFFITSKSLPENYRANSLFTLWTVLMLTSQSLAVSRMDLHSEESGMKSISESRK